MPAPPGTSPGSQRSTRSSSVSRPSPASCSTTVATKVFVTLPTRKRSRGRIGRRVARFSYPLTSRMECRPSRTSAIAPGAPLPATASSACCSSARSRRWVPALAVVAVVAAASVASASAPMRAIWAWCPGMWSAPSVGLLVAVRDVDDAFDRARGARREAEQPGGGERAGRVDEDEDLAPGVPAVERVRHVSGAAAGVAPERAARLADLLQAEPIRVVWAELSGRDGRPHQLKQVRAKQASAEEGAKEAGQGAGVGHERAGGPLHRRAADGDVLQRAEEVAVRVPPGDAGFRGQARGPQAQAREDAAAQLAGERVSCRRLDDETQDVVVGVR